jgi:hypothetical protein
MANQRLKKRTLTRTKILATIISICVPLTNTVSYTTAVFQIALWGVFGAGVLFGILGMLSLLIVVQRDLNTNPLPAAVLTGPNWDSTSHFLRRVLSPLSVSLES